MIHTLLLYSLSPYQRRIYDHCDFGVENSL